MIKPKVLGHPSKIGIIGGGQLGRMMALEAKRMGFRVVVFTEKTNSPAGQVSDEEVICTGETDDLYHAVLTAKTDVVTYESEQLPVAALKRLSDEGGSVWPSASTLGLMQDKSLQRDWLREKKIRCPEEFFRGTLGEYLKTSHCYPLPVIIKTFTEGYDGKGIRFLMNEEDLQSELAGIPPNTNIIVEELLNIHKEYSMIYSHDIYGKLRFFPTIENVHRQGILTLSKGPAEVDSHTELQMVAYAQIISSALRDYGVFCIEFIEDSQGIVYVNEICSRPHNSGHLTIEGCMTGQFEQHIRSIAGLPLGSTRIIKPAAMVNILGKSGIREFVFTALEEALRVEGVHLHIYGKDSIAANRKIGHITALDDCADFAAQKAANALDVLKIGESHNTVD